MHTSGHFPKAEQYDGKLGCGLVLQTTPTLESYCQSLFPHALFINLNALITNRSICIYFLCIHQAKLLLHNPQIGPQFQDIRVTSRGLRLRAFVIT